MEEKEEMSEEHEGGKTLTVERSIEGWIGRKMEGKEGLQGKWIDRRKIGRKGRNKRRT
jgi:hypothetical protein